MRLSVVLLLCALAGMVAGGWLIAPWAAGLCVIADSLAVGAYALLRETASGPAEVHELPTLGQVLERARAS
jgi:hypothetical protein